jgi:alkylation response protein AidB-like acyl-CoA dehydrogenase
LTGWRVSAPPRSSRSTSSFQGAAYSRNPQAKALADPLKQQVKDRGLWALFLDRDLGDPGFGPLMNQEIFAAYSMAEQQGGFDPALFRTRATRDGDEWVINGEKWFTSRGFHADIIFVMCANGMFVVPRKTPGIQIMEYLTPLQAMWASAPAMATADGVDEVHKVTVARNALKNY